MANTSAETIYVLHGPVPDLREARATETGGRAMRGQDIHDQDIHDQDIHDRNTHDQGMRADVAKLCAETSAQFGLRADCRQADREDELIDLIREADAHQAVGIVIDAGPCSNTSIALHDVLATVRIPMVEVHFSNARADDSFRHHCFTAKASLATLSGFGIDGYRLAIRGLAARTGVSAKA